MNSTIPPELVTAYSETVISIQIDDFDSIFIQGSANQTDAAVFQNSLGSKVQALWVITAENPYSQQLTAEENFHRQKSLYSALSKQGFEVLEAVCGSPDEYWSENSFAVPAEQKSAEEIQDAIHRLAREFGQNAVFKITPTSLSVVSTLDADQTGASEVLFESNYICEPN